MRELTYEEMEQVDGGLGPLAFGAVMGGAYGAVSGYDSGGIPGAIGGFALGSVTGFFGGIAAATTGVARVMFGAYSMGTHILNDRANDHYRNGGVS